MNGTQNENGSSPTDEQIEIEMATITEKTPLKSKSQVRRDPQFIPDVYLGYTRKCATCVLLV